MRVVSLPITKFEIEKYNQSFSKCKIYVAYHGENRNGDYISKRVFEDAIPTIYNIPIVGDYIEESENFGDHGGEIVVEGDSIVFKHTTVPIGMIPESARIYWETVTENDGSVHEYLVIDDAILWTGRYPEAELVRDYKFGQSMEINVLDGAFEMVAGKKLYNIKKFIFSALCILGISKTTDLNGHVEPCYESASIIAYQLNKEEFKVRFNELMNEIKKFNFDERGEKRIESMDRKGYIKKDENQSDKNGGKQMFDRSNYKLSHNQLIEEICKKIYEVKTDMDFWGEVVEVARYHYIDSDDSFVYTYDMEDEIFVKFPYTLSGDNVTIDFDAYVRVKPSWSDWEDGEDIKYSLNKEIRERFSEYAKKIQESKEEMSSSLAEKEEAILKLNTKYIKLQESVSEKDDTIAELEAKYSRIQDELREEKIKSIFDKYAVELKEFSESEIQELQKEATSYSSIDDFEQKVKAIMFDKIRRKLDAVDTYNINMGIPKKREEKNPQSIWDKFKNNK